MITCKIFSEKDVSQNIEILNILRREGEVQICVIEEKVILVLHDYLLSKIKGFYKELESSDEEITLVFNPELPKQCLLRTGRVSIL